MKRINLKNIKIILMSFIAILLILQLGCVSMVRAGLGMGKPVIEEMMTKFYDFQSAEVAKQGVPGLALTLSTLVELRPNDPYYVNLAAMLFTAWGLMYDQDDPKWSSHLMLIGQSYSLRAIKLCDDDIKKALEKDGKHLSDLKKEMLEADKDIVQPIFWYMCSTGLYMFQNMDNPYVMMKMADVTTCLDVVMQRDPNVFFGMPRIMDAVVAAVGGPLLGSTVEQAQKKFDDIFKQTDNKILIVHAMYAQFFAVTAVDEELFDKTIDYILTTPNDVLPNGQLINDMAKMRARWLKEHKSNFF